VIVGERYEAGGKVILRGKKTDGNGGVLNVLVGWYPQGTALEAVLLPMLPARRLSAVYLLR